MGFGNRMRGFAVLAVPVISGGVALAQSTLPPTSPTSFAPASAASPAPDVAPPPAPQRTAQVSYQSGKLTVIAENSSLNEILRDVVQQTGMKITGGVMDQRVFGTYGPAPLPAVLGRLLEGSGSNMILRETAANEPTELVLTPMQGRPTPPDLNVNFSSTPQPPSQPPAQSYQASPQPGFAPTQNTVPPPPRPQYFSQPPPSPASTVAPASVSSPTQQATPVTDTPLSPNGVLTPQQIYEQLQRLQQQKPAGSQ